MDARVGDRIVVDAKKLGQPARVGEVLEVRGDPPTVCYRVRWEDGHESIFFPGTTAHVARAASGSRAS